ncbi:MAG: Cof-type HAD-IIB family hydrolase [Clostridiaceae bacterium]|nr:Cof-type HAD-IIB family hydrolase [Clostridiaceae bacterium]
MNNIFDGYILATDMDGTLINSNRKISEANLKAIEYFVNNGGKFTVASGRMVSSVREFIEALKINCPTILHNGAKVYDYDKESVIKEHFIEEDRKDAIRRIYNDKPNIGIEIFADEVVYVYRSCKFTERYKRHNFEVIYNLPDEVWNKQWTKVLLIGEKDELDKVEKDYKENYDNGTSYRSGENYFDIVPNDINKGKALKELVEEEGIDPSKVIAVGDNMNDIEMIEYASYGFCVENGLDILKERAEYIAPCNDKDAIKYIINWLERKIVE